MTPTDVAKVNISNKKVSIVHQVEVLKKVLHHAWCRRYDAWGFMLHEYVQHIASCWYTAVCDASLDYFFWLSWSSMCKTGCVLHYFQRKRGHVRSCFRVKLLPEILSCPNLECCRVLDHQEYTVCESRAYANDACYLPPTRLCYVLF